MVSSLSVIMQLACEAEVFQKYGGSLVTQPVKDLSLSLLWGSFDPWPWNLYMLQACPHPEKKKKNPTGSDDCL